MASYKERLRRDLDRWIAAGLVPADNRDAILATAPEPARLDAATALAWVGGALLGVAVIAFTAANWDGISRLGRFAILIAAFLICAGAGAWAAHKQRPIFSDIALTIAALVFAASIGLTGQIFDIAGDERAALYASGVAAIALALAGRSIGAAIAALVLFGLGDFNGVNWSDSGSVDAPWLIVAAPLGVYLALRWKSAPLAHASAIGLLFALFWLTIKFDNESVLALLFSVSLAGAGAAARWLNQQDKPHASVFYGWAAWGALMFFAIAGYIERNYANEFLGNQTSDIVHRLCWLAASGATVALGRYDRHLLVTAIGVLSLIGAIAALLMDLGLDLMTAAALFFLCALGALVGGLMLRRKAKAP